MPNLATIHPFKPHLHLIAPQNPLPKLPIDSFVNTIMAEPDVKEEKDALDALELEAKEFDKVMRS